MNRVFASFYAWCRKPVTLMVMPSGTTSIFQLRLSRGVWMAALMLGIGMMGMAFFIVTQNINYFRAMLDNQRLRRQLARYERRVDEIKTAQEHVASMDSSLRELLGMKNKTNIVKASAVGGPKATSPITEQDPEEDRRIDNQLHSLKQSQDHQSISFEEIEQRIGELKTVYLSTPLGKPVRGGWITSNFGKRDQIGLPSRGGDEEGEEWHSGVDIASAHGAKMYATADGVVTFAGFYRGYGLLITIQHGLAYSTRYGHCSKLAVKTGERVARGQLIGYVGSTGHSTGPHVHYEVRQHEAAMNPMKFIREEW